MSRPPEPAATRADERFPNLRIVDHPLVEDALARLRDAHTQREGFRDALSTLSRLLAWEATRELPSLAVDLETPNGRSVARRVEGQRITLVAVLRAGLGMLPGMLDLLPAAAVGTVGLQRDEDSKRPREYFVKLPPDRGGSVFVVDPMIATGGSAVHTLDLMNAHGISDERICLVGMVAAPEGASRLLESHPGVRVFVAALDSHLNAAKEIVPGIGDAGDRLFGTE
jgi:uracil phosphoribosyltransferase